MSSTSVLEIDLARLDANVAVLRRILGPDVLLCCVVKAEGYGLGAERIGQRLQSAGVDLLAVYTMEQARRLVTVGITLPILVFMPLEDIQRMDVLYRPFSEGRLHCVVHEKAHLDALHTIAERFGCIAPVHIDLDTGIHRGGMNQQEAQQALEIIAADPRLTLAGVMTHFAAADVDPLAAEAQLDAFNEFRLRHADLIPQRCVAHASATHAALRHPKFHLDMVRIGMGWLGYGAEDLAPGDVLQEAQELAPILRWTSRIIHFKTIETGESVGYGSTWTARRPSVIGLVPVGYADGYRFSWSNKGVVRVSCEGQWYDAPVVGRVSMDQITIDVTKIADRGALRIGAEVELIGKDPATATHLPKLAAAGKTILHDVVCGLSPRIERHYAHAGDAPPPRPAAARRQAAGGPIRPRR